MAAKDSGSKNNEASSAKVAHDASTSTSASAPSSSRIKKSDKNKKIAVIGDDDTVIGFGLTGIKYLTTISEDTDNSEIILSIKGYIKNDEIGFIILTQSIAERIRPEFERIKLDKTLYPIFIELPDKRGELPDRVDPIKSLIRRAIGMEIVKENQ
jgi:V/A-type H+-transporting ATPase subunit F